MTATIANPTAINAQLASKRRRRSWRRRRSLLAIRSSTIREGDHGTDAVTVNEIDDLGPALASAYPELAAVREASDAPVYLVGGAVRDLLLARGRADIDLVVVGDAAELAARLGAEPREHERFGTAKLELAGHEVDIAGARTETYAHPGALPDVTPTEDVERDLGRRDF